MYVKVYMTNEEKRLAKNYAKIHGYSLNRHMKEMFFEKIEDEYDIACADSAMREYEKDHKAYTHDEVKNKLGI